MERPTRPSSDCIMLQIFHFAATIPNQSTNVNNIWRIWPVSQQDVFCCLCQCLYQSHRWYLYVSILFHCLLLNVYQHIFDYRYDCFIFFPFLETWAPLKDMAISQREKQKNIAGSTARQLMMTELPSKLESFMADKFQATTRRWGNINSKNVFISIMSSKFGVVFNVVMCYICVLCFTYKARENIAFQAWCGLRYWTQRTAFRRQKLSSFNQTKDAQWS